MSIMLSNGHRATGNLMEPCVVGLKMKTLFKQCRLANDLLFCENVNGRQKIHNKVLEVKPSAYQSYVVK